MRRLFIHQVTDKQGKCIQGEKNIFKVACDYFQIIFTRNNKQIDKEILESIPKLVTKQENQLLQAMDTQEELKPVVFSMNPHYLQDLMA